MGIPVARSADDLEDRLRRLEETLSRMAQAPPAPRPAEQIRPKTPAGPAEARGSFLSNIGKKLLAAAVVPSGPVTIADAAADPARAPRPVRDALAEARAIYRMFVDPRYRLSLAGRLVPLGLVLAIVTSYIWVPGTSIPFLGRLLDKVVDLVLAYVLFKFLGHEARRYRETAPDLPPSLRP
jgi:hypothetical protein